MLIAVCVRFPSVNVLLLSVPQPGEEIDEDPDDVVVDEAAPCW